jgi:hypothetical protein
VKWWIVNALAKAFVNGDTRPDAIAERSAKVLGRRWRWLRPFAVRHVEARAVELRPRERDIASFLGADEGFRKASSRHRRTLKIERRLPDPPRMEPWWRPKVGSCRALKRRANRRTAWRSAWVSRSGLPICKVWAEKKVRVHGFRKGRAERFSVHAAAVLAEEGFPVQHRKTRLMRRSVRQHLAGLVVNERLNVRRADLDELKAILTNCIRLGAASQNRLEHPDFRAHLRGRVAFVASVHAEKAKKLEHLFEQIKWN